VFSVGLPVDKSGGTMGADRNVQLVYTVGGRDGRAYRKRREGKAGLRFSRSAALALSVQE
jgi:hypothetical protein